MKDILEELVTKFTYDVDQAGLNKYLRSQDKINAKTKTMIGLNSTLGKAMKRLFVGAGAIMGVNSLIQTYRNFDLVQRSLNALSGSAEEGAKHFEFLKKAALDTATDFNQVAKAYRGYYYAAKTAGLTNEELQHSFLGVMIGARVLGSGKVSVGGAMLALEQMLNKTTVQAEEMNRQLGNAISGAREMSAEAMGMTVAEFTEKMQKKQIQSAEFVKKFGDYMYQTFIKKLPEALKSLDAGIINLQNAWLIFQHEIMKGGLGEELTKLTGQLMQLLLSPEAKGVAKTIGQGLNLVGKALSFIVKHFRAILFLWGVNALIQIPIAINAMKWRIIDLATATRTNLSPVMMEIVTIMADMITTGQGLKATLLAIGGVLKANIGKALALIVGFLFTPQGMILTAVAAALAIIVPAVQDLMMYLADPTALTLTRQLLTESPELLDMVKTFQQDIEKFKDIWVNELYPSLAEFMGKFSEWLKGTHPVLGGILKGVIWGLVQILNLLSKIFDYFSALSGRRGEKSQFDTTSRTLGGGLTGLSGAVVGGLAAGPVGAVIGGIGGYAAGYWGTGKMNQMLFPELVGGAGGSYNATRTQTINVNQNITNNVNASQYNAGEMMGMIDQYFSGKVDAAQFVIDPMGNTAYAGVGP